MARRSTSTAVAEPEVTEEVTEAPAEATTEGTGTNEAPAEAEAPIDLSGFQAAANEAVAQADESTGELPEAAVAPVNEAYRALDGLKAKNAARAWLEDQMKVALITEKNAQKARSYIDLKEKLSAGSKAASTKTPSDPTEAYVQQVAALMLGLQILQDTVPEGVSEDWGTKVSELLESSASEVESFKSYVEADDESATAPEVSPVVRKAFNLAKGKVSSRVSTPRDPNLPTRNILNHIKEAFADQPVGSFLTVGEISKFHSNEYGDDRPSPGAISARLFPKGKPALEFDGIQGSAEEGKPRGATKIA